MSRKIIDGWHDNPYIPIATKATARLVVAFLVWEKVGSGPTVCKRQAGWKLASAVEVEMTKLKDEDIRALFKAMHDPNSSTRKLATTGRGNAAEPYDGNNFISEFEAMLDTSFEVATEVTKKFGA